MGANTLSTVIPVQQGPNGRVGDNLIPSAGEVPGQLALFEVPPHAVVANGNGNGQAAPAQPGFNGRMLARGAERFSSSWLGATVHYATGIGGVACDVIAHAPSVVKATVRSVPDMVTAVALGPVDLLGARIGQANADYWTGNSTANLGHNSRLADERRAAASELGGGVLKWFVARRGDRFDGKAFGDRELLINHRAVNSAEWANSADATRRDMADSRGRIAARFRKAIGRTATTSVAQPVVA